MLKFTFFLYCFPVKFTETRIICYYTILFLQFIILAGHIEIVKLLLKHKSDPTIQDADGQTPLHRATAINNLDISKILLKESPQMVKFIDKRGRSPIDLLKESNKSKDHSKLLELLENIQLFM